MSQRDTGPLRRLAGRQLIEDFKTLLLEDVALLLWLDGTIERARQDALAKRLSAPAAATLLMGLESFRAGTERHRIALESYCQAVNGRLRRQR